MSVKQSLALVAALFVLGTTVRAQIGEVAPPDRTCPHQRVVSKDAEFRVMQQVVCGTNAALNVGGVRFETSPNQCPLLAHYIPPRTLTEHREGSNTYTKPEGTWRVMAFTFRCHTRWLFWIIPIEVGSTCDPVGSFVVSVDSNYAQYPCDY